MFRRTLALAMPTPANAWARALKGSAEYSETRKSSNSEYFTNLSKGQAPKILWIGCSDSRIPAEQILQLQAGDLFVHRNIANLVAAQDLSAMSVIEYAVKHLKVEHAVVCGHTGCGGVAAALGNKGLGVLDMWLHPLKQIRLKNKEELAKQPDGGNNVLEKLSVLHSLQVLRTIPTVIEAIQERGLLLHVLIYDIKEGKLEELTELTEENSVESSFEVFTLK